VAQDQGLPGSPVSPPVKASFLVNDHNRDEVRSLDDDIAIVSPLIDGRLKDVSADQH
jgi:5'-nucleotidase